MRGRDSPRGKNGPTSRQQLCRDPSLWLGWAPGSTRLSQVGLRPNEPLPSRRLPTPSVGFQVGSAASQLRKNCCPELGAGGSPARPQAGYCTSLLKGSAQRSCVWETATGRQESALRVAWADPSQGPCAPCSAGRAVRRPCAARSLHCRLLEPTGLSPPRSHEGQVHKKTGRRRGQEKPVSLPAHGAAILGRKPQLRQVWAKGRGRGRPGALTADRASGRAGALALRPAKQEAKASRAGLFLGAPSPRPAAAQLRWGGGSAPPSGSGAACPELGCGRGQRRGSWPTACSLLGRRRRNSCVGSLLEAPRLGVWAADRPHRTPCSMKSGRPGSRPVALSARSRKLSLLEPWHVQADFKPSSRTELKAGAEDQGHLPAATAGKETNRGQVWGRELARAG